MIANALSQPECQLVGISSIGLFDLIVVEWVDSLQPVPGWHMTNDLPALEAAKCKTVGWLVAHNDDALMIAQNIADPESSQEQSGGLMRIPKCCVTSASVLSSRLATKLTQPESGLASGLASRPRKGLWKPAWILWVLFVSLAYCVGYGKKLIFLSNVRDHSHPRTDGAQPAQAGCVTDAARSAGGC
jgi:hypothetical protein